MNSTQIIEDDEEIVFQLPIKTENGKRKCPHSTQNKTNQSTQSDDEERKENATKKISPIIIIDDDEEVKVTKNTPPVIIVDDEEEEEVDEMLLQEKFSTSMKNLVSTFPSDWKSLTECEIIGDDENIKKNNDKIVWVSKTVERDIVSSFMAYITQTKTGFRFDFGFASVSGCHQIHEDYLIDYIDQELLPKIKRFDEQFFHINKVLKN